MTLREVLSPYQIDSFAWLPGGESGIFSVRSGDATDIYIARPLIEVPRLIASFQRRVDTRLAPDGRYLLAYTPPYEGGLVYLVDVNDGNIRSLNRDFAVQSDRIDDMAWSPDGSRLAFRKITGQTTAIYLGLLYVLDLSTGDLTWLGEGGSRPRWSPDGRRLIFNVTEEHVLADDRISTMRQIFSVNADGTGLAELTAFVPPLETIFWLPDGDRFAWFGDEGAFYVMAADGKQPPRTIYNFDDVSAITALTFWR